MSGLRQNSPQMTVPSGQRPLHGISIGWHKPLQVVNISTSYCSRQVFWSHNVMSSAQYPLHGVLELWHKPKNKFGFPCFALLQYFKLFKLYSEIYLPLMVHSITLHNTHHYILRMSLASLVTNRYLHMALSQVDKFHCTSNQQTDIFHYRSCIMEFPSAPDIDLHIENSHSWSQYILPENNYFFCCLLEINCLKWWKLGFLGSDLKLPHCWIYWNRCRNIWW